MTAAYDDAGFILVSEKRKDNSEIKKRIIRVEDISREGVSVVHDGSLQKEDMPVHVSQE